MSKEIATELTTWQELFSHLPLFSSTFTNESTHSLTKTHLKFHGIFDLPKLLGVRDEKTT